MTMTIEEELALIHKKGQAAPPVVPTADAPAAPTNAMNDLSAAYQDAIKPKIDQTAPPTAPPVTPPPADLADAPPLETGLPAPPGADTSATTWDVAAATWTRDTITRDAWDYAAGRRNDLIEQMYRALPAEAQARADESQRDHTTDWRSFEQKVMDEAAKFVATDPTKWGDLPLTQEQFEARLDDADKAALADAEAILSQPGGAMTEFFTSMARSVTTPESLALMPFGGAAGSFGKFILSEMALGAVGSVAGLPGQYDAADRLDLPTPDAVTQVATDTLFSGLFAGGLAAIGKGLHWAMGRERTKIEARPEGEDPLDFGANVDRAQAEMTGDRTVQEATRPQGSLSEPPPVPAGAPPNWGQIRNGIFAGESGGDYDALFGFNNRPGGVFENVKLTKMTVDEAIAFSAPGGAYGQWVNSKIGRVATPMGAYQIVGTTLRAAKKGLGLTGKERMTPDLQERLGIWIYGQQGTGAWAGYRGPRADFRPASGDLPAFTGEDTSRGYTGSGQVSAGDGTRVDVNYEVVDYASLIRASGDLQPRDRSRINSDAWIADTAARLDPAQLMPSPNAAQGTPIVGPDNMIESGNGRVSAIGRAYERVPDRAQAYRAAIEAAGYSIPEGVTQPVLIARRTSKLDAAERQRFVIEAQDSGVAQMTPTEMARATARSLQAPILARLDPTQPIISAANGDFVRAALATLPRSARNAMFDATGALNGNGQRQLREALFARAWPDPDILARYTEGGSPELKSLLEALETAAPNWAALRADIEAGLVSPEMDISPYVLDAMRLIGAARDMAARNNKTMAKALGELLDQVDMLDGAVSPLTTALVRKFWSNGRAAPADQVAAFLARYADEARDAGRLGGMLDAPTPRDVLRTVDGSGFADLPEDLGRARGFATKSEPQASMGDEAFTQGAQSPEVEAVNAEIEASIRQGQANTPPLSEVLRDTGPKSYVREVAGSQPVDTIDELYARAAPAQDRLASVAARIADNLGIPFKDPGLKDRATAIAKMQRKGYNSPRNLTDISRAGFVVKAVDDADTVVDKLAADFNLIDEGWVRTQSGYIDRKVMIIHDDGMLSEVQIWTEPMRAAKSEGGPIYRQERMLDPASAERRALQSEQEKIYAAAVGDLKRIAFSADGTSNAPKLREKPATKAAAEGSTPAVAQTSDASTDTQSVSRSSLASAKSAPDPSRNSTAGRPSQLQYDSNSIGEVPSLDPSNVGADPGLVNSADPILDQAVTANVDAQAAIASARAGGDFSIEMPDGTTYSATEVLDDIDADANADFQITFCTTNSGAE